MKKLLILLALISAGAQAQPFVSIGGGVTSYSASNVKLTQDQDYSFTGAAGYQFTPFFALSAGVSHGGAYARRNQVTKVNSQYVAAIFSAPIYGRVYGFTGVGLSNATVKTPKGTNNIVNPAVGLGLGYRVNQSIDLTLTASDVGNRFLGLKPSVNSQSLTTSLKYNF
jgi:hypothetical protein